MSFQVFNAGFPGDTTLELLKRFQRDVAARQPDLVVLLIGSNDMLYPGHVLDIADYRRNLNTLLDRIGWINAECILMTAPCFITALLLENYPDTLQYSHSPEERLALVNNTIREVATERDLELVDLYKIIDPVDDSAGSMILNPANSNRRDGMHLTADGNRKAAGAVYRVWQRCFSDRHTIVCLGDSLTYGVYMPGKGSARTDALTYPGILADLLQNS